MPRSDYCSDYERQKSEFQNSIATIVATTPFKTDLNGRSSAKASIRKRKLKSLSSLAPAFWRGVRLSPPRGKSASIAFWYQKAACRENPDPNMPPAGGERSAVRKNQYNLHIRLDEDERAALEKGLQTSGLPLSAYLRKLILGESIQAAPSEELRRLRTEIHQIGNNINQLARKANAGFASRDEITRALRMLDRVYELMYGFSK
ncbi:MAG: MobC family plasmid mobilization relaxosome protein [Oscillospiraceae bacterium]